MSPRVHALTALLASLATVACGQARPSGKVVQPLWVAPDIQARRAQFVRESLDADTSELSPTEAEALAHLVKAARVIDAIFASQAWQGNPAFAPRVAALTGPNAQAAKDYYRIMAGPWDRLKAFEPFLGTAPHPEGAGFYPEDMSRGEFEAFLTAHPSERAAFTSTTTVIRRSGGTLVAVPYSKEYKEWLGDAAGELRAAAAVTTNDSLRKFLTLRAEAFASDDYYASDLAWMDLDSPIEVVIGPYETYEDGLFGYKAAFEAFVCVTERKDSEQLAKYKGELPYLESRLPIPDEYKNPKRGADSPIRVVDEVVTAGDARRGVQTVAFNLPNDERVREAKGSKKVLLKNMMRAKYDGILAPIAARTLLKDEAGKVDFDSYFHHTLLHELSHGLGPGRITVNGRSTEVRLELKELFPAIEEAKADVLGVYNLAVLANRGVVPVSVVQALPWTYLAGLFRAARFGTTEAHGLGCVIQANYLLAKGAIEVTPDGRFRPVLAKFAGGIKELAHDLLMVEAQGSYAGAQAMVKTYGAVQAPMARLLASLKDIPVDVDPAFAVDSGK
jgi:Peptidase family M49